MTLFTILFFALILDAILGEPKSLWEKIPHPITLVGKAIDYLDISLNAGDDRKVKGIAALGLISLVGIVAGLIVHWLPEFGVVELIAVTILIAHRSLIDHVSDVSKALKSSLEAGRKSVGMIVGRDPSGLDANGVSRAAIESAAENFSDGVVAPMFWYIIAGLPGLFLYKIINTADSMIGYKNDEYTDFGWAAAKVDDVLNWIPARLTGGLIAFVFWSQYALDVMKKDARLHRSPNAGWPEAAMAGVLGIALSGPRSYDGELQDFPFVNAEARIPLSTRDIDASLRVLWRVWFAIGAVVGVFSIF